MKAASSSITMAIRAAAVRPAPVPLTSYILQKYHSLVITKHSQKRLMLKACNMTATELILDCYRKLTQKMKASESDQLHTFVEIKCLH